MLDIRVRGILETIEALDRLEFKLNDTRDLWNEHLEAFVVDQVENVFDNVYPGRLVRTGRYKRSLTIPGSQDNVSRATRNRFVFGTRVPYSIYVEAHSPVLGLLAQSDPFQRDVERIAQRWLDNEIDRIFP